MILSDLLVQARAQLDDTALPTLWSDPDVTGWLNEAIDEVCLRRRGILDSTTPSICSLAITPYVQRYHLDPTILKVERVRLGSNPVPLKKFTMGLMDDRVEYWDFPYRAGPPQFWFSDQDNKDHLVLVVVPFPNIADTMALSVWRMPLDCEYLKAPKDTPPMPFYLHRGLTDWVEYRAYDRKDAETYDPARSDRAYKRFEDRYGKRPSADALKLMGENALRGVQPQYF
ncbi:hypothetical protein [Dokdonella soli]|uniref:Uncharacterized protein n=1 Tax=Dokdonella soli TaxID=529810 RepID=A0ABP3U341_9GAMM